MPFVENFNNEYIKRTLNIHQDRIVTHLREVTRAACGQTLLLKVVSHKQMSAVLSVIKQVARADPRFNIDLRNPIHVRCIKRLIQRVHGQQRRRAIDAHNAERQNSIDSDGSYTPSRSETIALSSDDETIIDLNDTSSEDESTDPIPAPLSKARIWSESQSTQSRAIPRTKGFQAFISSYRNGILAWVSQPLAEFGIKDGGSVAAVAQMSKGEIKELVQRFQQFAPRLTGFNAYLLENAFIEFAKAQGA